MAYFIKLFDRNLKVIGAETWTKTQYAVSSFSLQRSANEFDVFTAESEEVMNSKSAVYAGLFDSDGYLVYLSLCGIPVTKDHKTTVNGYDLRKFIKNTVRFDQKGTASTGHNYSTLADWYSYLLTTALVDATAKDLVTIDVSKLKESSLKWDSAVLSGEDETTDLWETLVYWNSYFGVTVLVYVDFSLEKPIIFRALPVDSLISINLSDYDIQMTEDMFAINEVRIYHKSASGTELSPSRRFFRLSNDDIREISNTKVLATAYDENQTGYGYFGGKNIYAGQVYGSLRRSPTVLKEIIYDSTEYDAKSGYEKEDSEDPEDKAISDAVKTLSEQRMKNSVTISMDSRMATADIYYSPTHFFIDEDGNEDLTRPFRFYGRLYNYYMADSSTFRAVPVGTVSIDFQNGKRTLSVKFGYLSQYWFLKN